MRAVRPGRAPREYAAQKVRAQAPREKGGELARERVAVGLGANVRDFA